MDIIWGRCTWEIGGIGKSLDIQFWVGENENSLAARIFDGEFQPNSPPIDSSLEGFKILEYGKNMLPLVCECDGYILRCMIGNFRRTQISASIAFL